VGSEGSDERRAMAGALLVVDGLIDLRRLANGIGG
jgi:hypothetical protein